MGKISVDHLHLRVNHVIFSDMRIDLARVVAVLVCMSCILWPLFSQVYVCLGCGDGLGPLEIGLNHEVTSSPVHPTLESTRKYK